MSARHKDAPPPPLEAQLCFGIYSAGMAIQRAYKQPLDQLGLTYPQYLVLNVLWSKDEMTVGLLADTLALESSTLTPLLKRLEGRGLVRRARNPKDERQVVIVLTELGKSLQGRAGCLGTSLLTASAQTPEQLAELNQEVRNLRDAIYAQIGGWAPPA